MSQRDRARGDRIPTAILFTDIVDSTVRAGELGDERWREILRSHHVTIRRELKRHGGREVDNAGDGFFAAFASPAAAIRCACAIVDAIKPLGIEVRAGIHVGEAVRVGDKPGGMAVHIGSRIAGAAGPGEVAVSGTVRDLTAGSGIAFEDRGVRPLKGVEGEWRIYAVLRKGDLGPRELTPERPPEDRRATRSVLELARRRWMLPAAAVAMLALFAVVALVLTRADPDPARSPVSGSPAPPETGPQPPYDRGLFVIDPETDRVIQANRDFTLVNGLLPHGDSVWVGADFRTLARYVVAANDYEVRLQLPNFRSAPSMVIVEDSLWVLVHKFNVDLGEDELFRLDPSDGTRRNEESFKIPGLTTGLVFTRGLLWTAVEGEILAIDPESGAIVRKVGVPGVVPTVMVADGDVVYVLDSINAVVFRVDLGTERTRRLGVDGVLAVDVGADHVWVTTDDGHLLGLDPQTLLPEFTNRDIGKRAFEIDVGPDAVWIGSRDGRVLRVNLDDPELVAATIDLGARLDYIDLAATGRVVWLSGGRF